MNYINKNRFIAFILFLSLLFSFLFSSLSSAKENISDSVLRLHVIANSNSKEDQALKLKVRDRILSDTKDLFKNTQSPSDALDKAKSKKDLILASAKAALKENGSAYDVKVKIGENSFPIKSYESITLPEGKYTSVSVIIGNGEGKNWWCVMFPPLCLVKGTVSLPEKSDNYLRENLSKSEYALIKNDSELPFELKFKIVEILKNFTKAKD